MYLKLAKDDADYCIKKVKRYKSRWEFISMSYLILLILITQRCSTNKI